MRLDCAGLCGVNGNFHPEFPTWHYSLYIPMDVCHSRASGGSGAKGREKAAILPSLPCLVPN